MSTLTCTVQVHAEHALYAQVQTLEEVQENSAGLESTEPQPTPLDLSTITKKLLLSKDRDEFNNALLQYFEHREWSYEPMKVRGFYMALLNGFLQYDENVDPLLFDCIDKLFTTMRETNKKMFEHLTTNKWLRQVLEHFIPAEDYLLADCNEIVLKLILMFLTIGHVNEAMASQIELIASGLVASFGIPVSGIPPHPENTLASASDEVYYLLTEISRKISVRGNGPSVTPGIYKEYILNEKRRKLELEPEYMKLMDIVIEVNHQRQLMRMNQLYVQSVNGQRNAQLGPEQLNIDSREKQMKSQQDIIDQLPIQIELIETENLFTQVKKISEKFYDFRGNTLAFDRHATDHNYRAIRAELRKNFNVRPGRAKPEKGIKASDKPSDN